MQIITNDIFNLKHVLTKIKLFKQINWKKFFLQFVLFHRLVSVTDTQISKKFSFNVSRTNKKIHQDQHPHTPPILNVSLKPHGF